MAGVRVFITGTGLITPVGRGAAETRSSIMKGLRGIGPVTLFPVPHGRSLPVGEVRGLPEGSGLPRTHRLALLAAREALAGSKDGPGAIVLGVTTGGMDLGEKYLQADQVRREVFTHHAAGSVAEYLARELGCRGPVITVSTACSSGTAALKIALEILRQGKATNALVGGADSLCRLTYHGFHALQLVDPEGGRPLDLHRRGMTVSEGAGMLFLEAGEHPPETALAEVLGGGLSCDAFHPASPDPEGTGALAAMRAAMEDGGVLPWEIDYISLHGTGTVDNDLSEATALNRLFTQDKPLLSSVKGAFGHSLAASGAIEAVISAMCINDGFVPGNTGCATPDPGLGLNPLMEPVEQAVNTVLSNSFGFGGNNASVVIGSPKRESSPRCHERPSPLRVVGSACITGAGKTPMTWKALSEGRGCHGILPDTEVSADLPPKNVRRVRRLSRLALSLAVSAHGDSGETGGPDAVFFGTGWGPLSETHEFFARLYESGERFASPTDFIGSVHNAPAGLIAIHFRSTGPNITTTGGDYSFEQALMTADLLAGGRDPLILVAGADENHSVLSPLFDDSVWGGGTPSDGGGALCLRRSDTTPGPGLLPVFLEYAGKNPHPVSPLVDRLGGPDGIRERYGAILAGIPLSHRDMGRDQLSRFLNVSGFEGPVIDYRRFTGEFASASAVAAVLGVSFVREEKIPEPLCQGKSPRLNGKGVLLMGLGKFVTAVEVMPAKPMNP